MSNPFQSEKAGSVASRFVSSGELTEAQQKRASDLKAAYERIGQEPPPEPVKEEYDPRSLYERLKANKDAKQEKFDETWKLSNQFRGIDEGESDFLADIAKERRQQELKKAEEERRELEEFRKRTQASAASPPLSSSPDRPSLVGSSNSPPAPSSIGSAASPPSASSQIARVKRPAAAAPASSSASSSKSQPKASKKKRDGALLGIRRKPTSASSANDRSKKTTDSPQGQKAPAVGSPSRDGVKAPSPPSR